jgi:hypothetical protein
MSRFVCLSLLLGGLVATSGCSSCFGGNSCRRPSFMEFRSPCGGRSQPCTAPMAAPMCEPACGPACGAEAAPCCGEGGVMSAPMSAPIVGEPGTFS